MLLPLLVRPPGASGTAASCDEAGVTSGQATGKIRGALEVEPKTKAAVAPETANAAAVVSADPKASLPAAAEQPGSAVSVT